MGNGVGLVLAGGGGKGAYFIGVWKALIEYGVDKNITSLSGTSVGALNSVLFAQSDYDIAERVWRKISSDKILKVDIKKIVLGLLGTGFIKGELAVLNLIFREFYGSGIFSREGLIEIIDEDINLSYVSNCVLDIYAAAYNTNTLKVDYLKINNRSNEKIKKILLASSALPVIYDKVEINGQYYIDGSIKDNIPIKPLYEDGLRNFIVVHLGRDSLINKNQFKDANIIEIVPSLAQGDLITGTLDFSQEGVDKRIKQGYQDAIRVLKPLYQMGVVQAKIGKTLEQFKSDELNFSKRKKEILSEREELKGELDIILNLRRSH